MPKTRFTSRYKRLLTELRRARETAGITQVQVAKRFDTHASFISKIESGERRLDVIELADFCDFYGVRLSQLLERAGLL
jgi:transcriptional regulator with XRE-family HTH domain